ncbi:MAG: glycoside hydrolase family 44 protein, partial [Candidatus Goldbacteria bacterium]|nr:glycoside hydrolase family 44 protein [Candidatus Goldiibacteriota bacterium]
MKKILNVIFIFTYISLYSANITINTSSGRQAISPYIYGTNQLMEGGENTTLYRLGGNRLTGYNWENNYSNAGSDWYHTSDTWLCSSNYGFGADCNQPGGLIRRFHQESLSRGMQSIITVPMAGYVAADQAGTVTLAQTAPSARWKQVIPKKPGPLVYPPDLTDNYVYVDEEVNYLVSQFGNASTPTGVKFYALDNEPALWNETHPRIHPTPCYAAELVNKSIATAKAIKDVDPYCEIFGPVFFGFWSMNDLQNPPDWATEKGSYQWYVDYYLAKMKQASDADGRRLLDALDFHWYSEAREGLAPPFTYSTPGVCRITEDTCTSSAAQIARMQAPRTLWDSTYVENSPIAQWYSWALPLLPKVQNSINTYYPGTKIAITEFAHGGGNDYSGGISMADTLGIFGKYGVYAATMWKTAYGPYHSAAYKIFRNYNGANGKYGDTKVYCESNDVPNITAYASINGSDESELHIIVINKAGTNQTANVNITSPVTYTSAECWGFGGSSYNITSRTAPVLSGNSFSYSVPAYTVLHFVLRSNTTPTNTPIVTASNTRTTTPTRTVTMTNTLAYTKTITPTYSFTATTGSYTATMTPTLFSTNFQSVLNNVFIFPNPIIKDTQKVFFYYGISNQINSIKLKIYTLAFRTIQEIYVPTNSSGISEIPYYKIKNLAAGMYFYIVI